MRKDPAHKPHQLDMYRSRSKRVALCVFNQNRRGCEQSIGVRAVVAECGYDVEMVDAHDMAGSSAYDVILMPMLSVLDVGAAIEAFHGNRPRGRVVAGGAGALSITPLSGVCDSVFFGRAEGLVRSIVDGDDCSPYAARPGLGTGKYMIRKPQWLLPGEVSVGCNRRCRFCQYAHIRPKLGHAYHHGGDMRTPEVTFDRLVKTITGPGRYTTSLDGFSEDSRRRVHKPMSDRQIVETIADLARRNYARPVVIKIFEIVGYPWETRDSVMVDIRHTGEILREADAAACCGRVLIMFCLTPFSPEPLTPMAHDGALMIDWRDAVASLQRPRQVFNGRHIEGFILPQIPGPYTLAKRCAINRGVHPDDYMAGVSMARSSMGSMAKADAFLSVVGEMHTAGVWPHSPDSYLRVEQ